MLSITRWPNRIISLALLLLFAVDAFPAELASSVDRNRLSINETLTLTLRYDDSADTDDLELESLRQDFDILSVRPQNSSSVSIVNGNYSQQTLTTWTINLAPKREGTLVIPSFNVDGNISDAIAIEVTQASSAPARDTPMMVTLETDLSRAHVGQQILVKVELRAQDHVTNLSGGQLSLPNAHLELLDQQSFRRVENGISWQVVEWEYALIPEQSGTLELPPQLFSGIIGGTNNFGFPDPFNQRGRRISARSSAQQIEVIPPPETNGLPWFPASNVQVNSSWSGDTSKMRVGEPLTRTVEIIATGQRSSAIPPLQQSDSLTYKVYADQPQLLEQASSSGIIGTRRESTAIVPSAAGELRLPEQRIAWWNTNTQTWEETLIPAETLQVLPAQQDSSFAPPGSSTFSPPMDQIDPEMSANQTSTGKTAWYWPVSTLILALIVAWQSWLLLGSGIKAKPETGKQPDQNEAQRWKMVQRALRSDNSATLRKAILNWAQTGFPDTTVNTLDKLARQSTDSRLQALLNQLDASLYANSPAPDFAELGKAMEQLRQELATSPDHRPALKPLYPN